MMKIKIVAVGKVKEKYFTDAANEYLKRLTRFAKVEIKEVKECNFTSNEPSESEIKEILRREGEEIKKELSGFKFYANGEKNHLSLCNLLKKYNFYENVLANC